MGQVLLLMLGQWPGRRDNPVSSLARLAPRPQTLAPLSVGCMTWAVTVPSKP